MSPVSAQNMIPFGVVKNYRSTGRSLDRLRRALSTAGETCSSGAGRGNDGLLDEILKLSDVNEGRKGSELLSVPEKIVLTPFRSYLDLMHRRLDRAIDVEVHNGRREV
jgi:hypothetical protein